MRVARAKRRLRAWERYAWRYADGERRTAWVPGLRQRMVDLPLSAPGIRPPGRWRAADAFDRTTLTAHRRERHRLIAHRNYELAKVQARLALNRYFREPDGAIMFEQLRAEYPEVWEGYSL